MVSRNGEVTKAGAGLWILGNLNNTYGGATTITQGVLRAQDGAGIPSGIASNALGGVSTLATGTSTTDFWVNSTNGLVLGQAVTGGGTGTITSILETTDDASHASLASFALNVPAIDWMNAVIAKANGDQSLIEALTSS